MSDSESVRQAHSGWQAEYTVRLYRDVADGVPQRHVVSVPSPGWTRAGAVGLNPSQSPASDSEAESARCPGG
jgi:hypothetical protein